MCVCVRVQSASCSLLVQRSELTSARPSIAFAGRGADAMPSDSLMFNKLLNFWWSLCCCCCCCQSPMANRKLIGSARAADASASLGSQSARKPIGQRCTNVSSPSAANPWPKSRSAADAPASTRAADIRVPVTGTTRSIRGMNDEAVRLKTFLNSWSTQHQLGPSELARNGFFRKGSGAADDDWVQCAFCDLAIESKHLGNRVHDQHLLISPSCRLARGERTNNMTTPATIQCRQQIGPCHNQPSMQTPKFPDYCDRSNRRSSFVDWRREPSSSRLAEAGFFYTGPADMVTCFCCGQSLKDWRSTDDPFVEHARWSKECPFLLETKGYDYVVAVSVAMGDVCGPRGEVHPVSEVMEAQRLPGERTRAYDVTGHERLPVVHPSNQHGLGIHSTATAPVSATTATHVQVGSREALGGLSGVFGSRNASYGTMFTGQPQPTAQSHSESSNSEQLRDRLTCKICMDRQVCITFRPCGHLCVCQECSASVSACPMCRGRIQERQLTFLS